MRNTYSVMKRFTLFLATILTVIPLSSGFVRAAELPALTDAAQNDFETRRTVLIKVFELSKSEILDLQLRLSAIDRPTDAEFSLVYDALARGLEDHLSLIESRMKELSSSYITLDGVRVTADNFKKWRETVYDPGTRELFDFLILQQGSSILSIVESRYEKVATDVEHLKVSVEAEKAEAFETMLKEARARVENAKLLRDEARTLFLNAFKARHPELGYKFGKIGDKQVADIASTLMASPAAVMAPSVVEKPKTILDMLDISKETVQTLMKRAVDEIAETYKIFLQMRELVRQR